MWDRFHEALSHIKNQVSSAERVTMMFHGWSTVRNDAALGRMVSYLDDYLELTTRVVGNIREQKSHRVLYLCKLISQIVTERLEQRVPDYFVSESAAGNKVASVCFLKTKEINMDSLVLVIFTLLASLASLN